MYCETAVIDGHKTKYCYSESGALEKVITYLEDGSTVVENIFAFSTTVSDDLFKVPAGYRYVEAV